MSSPNRHEPQRQIEITRRDDGWSIKVRDSNPETRHKPLSPEEREVVREDVKRGVAARGD
jgi:hypothetical protein